MNEKYEELLRGLPAEVQDELKGAATQEEVMAVLSKHAVPLPDEVLEGVAGGFSWAEVKPV